MVVAKAVAELEAERMILGLQLLADLVQLVPGLREFLDADFGEVVGAPVHQLTDIGEGDGLPLAVDEDAFLAGVVPAALRLADVVGDIADVEIFVAELDDLEQAVHGDVGARSGLGDRADPCRQAADAGHLVVDLDAGGFLVGRSKRVRHILVERFDERAFVQDGDGLVGGRGRPGAQRGRGGAACRDFEKIPSCLIGDPRRHGSALPRLVDRRLAARFFFVGCSQAYINVLFRAVENCERGARSCPSLVRVSGARVIALQASRERRTTLLTEVVRCERQSSNLSWLAALARMS